MKRSSLHFSTRELLLRTALVALSIFGTIEHREASRIKEKIKALIPVCEIKIEYPDPECLHALGGRFSLTGVIRFPADTEIPAKLIVRSHLKDPASGKKYVELDGKIGRHDDAGVHFEIELPPPAMQVSILPTRPTQPGTYICTIEAFDGNDRLTIAATPMTFVPSPQ
ncbi:MAG: hypothetical protein NTU79_10455 [Planctomycetota bacterium]|nr:hypothetical protein [Planctomycetota bacterium]